ncbi:response regulator [Vibrio sp. SCSIO 43132]|uniref:HD domain-containing phosphohydrolase n=1 Tax=Vibrio sp. SCSIO 43132 TaxID=2779363 RepID=UPI001CA9D73F|nr:HD domain-containing phosphohydrolase [Vibrio sp. SCSIO 43132]UAB72184.1 response regulator [Vibrio sp. SCSIO 43132]
MDGTHTKTLDIKPKLLLVDDEEDIVRALTRVLRRDFDIISFTDPTHALAHLEDHPVPLMVSDMRMPQMDGAEFFSKAKALQPNSVRVLLTGYADVEATMRAINDGGVNNYLCKPWDNENLKFTLLQSYEFYQLHQERFRLANELEEKNEELNKLNSSLEEQVVIRTAALRESHKKLELSNKTRSTLLKDVLALVTSLVGHRAGISTQSLERIAYQSKQVAVFMDCNETQINQTYLSSIMHMLGLIGKDHIDSTQNFQHTHIAPSNNPELGAEILNSLKKFQSLAPIVRSQDENYDGTGIPDHLKSQDIPLASRIIRVVKDYEFMVAGEENTSKKSPFAAAKYLESNSGKMYDRAVVKAFTKVMKERPQDDLHEIEYCVSSNELTEGDILKQDVMLQNGTTVLTAGSEINQTTIARLRDIEKQSGSQLAFFI